MSDGRFFAWNIPIYTPHDEIHDRSSTITYSNDLFEASYSIQWERCLQDIYTIYTRIKTRRVGRAGALSDYVRWENTLVAKYGECILYFEAIY